MLINSLKLLTYFLLLIYSQCAFLWCLFSFLLIHIIYVLLGQRNNAVYCWNWKLGVCLYSELIIVSYLSQSFLLFFEILAQNLISNQTFKICFWAGNQSSEVVLRASSKTKGRFFLCSLFNWFDDKTLGDGFLFWFWR